MTRQLFRFPISMRGRTMKFFSSSRRHRSQGSKGHSAAVQTEAVEQRLVLTPAILTPTGTVTTATPEITWTAEPSAESYDVWISSIDAFETVRVERGVADNTYTPDADLPLGRLRIWVRANFSDGSSTPWSTPAEAIIQAPPVVTGPVGVGARHVTPDNTPVITWDSPDLAYRFQIWLTDVTAGTATQYTVDNLTPLLDDTGAEVLDGDGNVIPEEVRSFEIPNTLNVGRYRVWVRSIDQTGRLSDWSGAYSFDVGTPPENLSPAAPTFQTAPLLKWDAVPGATDYEVYVASQPYGVPVTSGSFTQLYRETVSTNSFQIPKALNAGGYVFWVRAINITTGKSTVYGAWSEPAQFSTIIAPEIIGPVAQSGVVTAAQPTVEWTAIDGAARYDIYVHRFNTPSPYLQVQSSTDSYTFTERLPAGTYYIYVRAIDTRGNFSPWSNAYEIVATGGAPVVLTPVANSTQTFPEYSWTPVEGAASYELWVSYVGVDFTYINVSGITDTTYTSGPVDPGTYRVWVRAILSDGTSGPWSSAIDFFAVAASEQQQIDTPSLLASVEVNLLSEERTSASAAERTTVEPPEIPEQAALGESSVAEHHQQADDDGLAPASVDVLTPQNAGDLLFNPTLPTHQLAILAEDCLTKEWWQEETSVEG